jgi:hypothetical protein
MHIALQRQVEQLVIAGELRRQDDKCIIARGDDVTHGTSQSPERLSYVLEQPLHRGITPEELRELLP